MEHKINIAVFASTKGSDLQAIINAQKAGELGQAELKFVLSDKKDCYALERAKQGGIKTYFIDPTGKSREEFDEECLKVCQAEQIDYIFLIGYMRIISQVLIQPYQNKIINIHPSLLPKYGGGMDLNVHEEVLKNKEKETGCTLHYVSEKVDEGEIILKEKVSIEPGETPESLKTKVQQKEQELILRYLKSLKK